MLARLAAVKVLEAETTGYKVRRESLTYRRQGNHGVDWVGLSLRRICNYKGPVFQIRGFALSHTRRQARRPRTDLCAACWGGVVGFQVPSVGKSGLGLRWGREVARIFYPVVMGSVWFDRQDSNLASVVSVDGRQGARKENMYSIFHGSIATHAVEREAEQASEIPVMSEKIAAAVRFVCHLYKVYAVVS